jgi:hypothetical protein
MAIVLKVRRGQRMLRQLKDFGAALRAKIILYPIGWIAG